MDYRSMIIKDWELRAITFNKIQSMITELNNGADNKNEILETIDTSGYQCFLFERGGKHYLIYPLAQMKGWHSHCGKLWFG